MKIYFAAAYRGALGDNTTDEIIAQNVRRATEIGDKLQELFPDIDVFIPHKELIGNTAWKIGLLTSEDIVNICCEIVSRCDLIVALKPISPGMALEIEMASELAIPVIYINALDASAVFHITKLISRIKERA